MESQNLWLTTRYIPLTDQEIGINGFLRDNVLDETGALIVDIDDLDFATDGVIYDGHDPLTQSKISLARKSC